MTYAVLTKGRGSKRWRVSTVVPVTALVRGVLRVEDAAF